MAIDLTGGFSDDREYVFATRPDDPEIRESVNAWIWDNGAEFGMPRIGVEAVADQWDTHDIQVNLAFADGRVFNMFGPGKVHDPLGADGRPRILGAGPLSFELIEPYRHWRFGSTARRPRRRPRRRSTAGWPGRAEAPPSRWNWRSTSDRPCRRGRSVRSVRIRPACWRPKRRAT